MATPPLITLDPITEEQRDWMIRFTGLAAKKAIETQNLSELGGRRIITRSDELEMRITAAIHELSLELPDLDSFTVADWEKFYPDATGVKPLEFPWSDATLNSPCPFHKNRLVRETHFAFVGVDTITMMELQKLNPKKTEPRFSTYATESWYSQQEFATKTTLASRWYLLLKNIVPDSENKKFDVQEAMLPKEYEVPSAVAETAKDILFYKKIGTYVNPVFYARTADLDADGLRIRVGCCRAGGIHVNFNWSGRRGGLIGVGASRKFDQDLAA